MSLTSPVSKRAALAGASLTAVFAAGFLSFFIRFLGDEAQAALPFGGHTVPLGYDFIWANRVAVLFVILCAMLVAHSLARIVQMAGRWRARA